MASAYAVLSVKNAYRKVWNLMQNKILFTAPGEFDKWEQQCQPIGNGYMGASFFGGISKEKIVLNEKTLWAGGPSESRPDYNSGIIDGSYEYVKQVQRHRRREWIISCFSQKCLKQDIYSIDSHRSAMCC